MLKSTNLKHFNPFLNVRVIYRRESSKREMIFLHIHMRMQLPQKATTLEICSARPHSGLIRQSRVCRQHLGQLLPELLLLSVSLYLCGCVCLVSECFSFHSSLWPFPMMPLFLRAKEAGGMFWLAEKMDWSCEEKARSVTLATFTIHLGCFYFIFVLIGASGRLQMFVGRQQT